MEPKIIELPEKKVVGVGTKFISARSPKKNNMEKIPPLWHEFVNKMSAIPNRVNMIAYGLCESLPENDRSDPDEVFYIGDGLKFRTRRHDQPSCSRRAICVFYP